MKPRYATLFTAIAFVLLLPALSWAHAFLDHATPRVGSTIKEAPTEVRIWFTEEVELAFSTIQVLDAGDKQIDKKDMHLDAKDKTQLVVSLPEKLPAGKYKVVWKVVSSDTHKTNGDFTFEYKP